MRSGRSAPTRDIRRAIYGEEGLVLVEVLQTGQVLGKCTSRVYALERGDRRFVDKRDWEGTFKDMGVLKAV